MSRYLVLVGGGGSGKSIFAGQKLIYRTMYESGHRFLVCRKVAKTNRESTFQQLRSQLTEFPGYSIDDWEINKTDMRITYKPNGNEIIFVGLDDVEKLKSIYNITNIWIEEASELEPDDYRQLDIRLRGVTKNYKQIMFTFNPVSITHWLKSEFFDVQKADTTTLHTTYKDNKFLDDEAIRVLESFKNTDPYYYQVYCQGAWGVLGKTIFDAQKVTERLIAIRDKKPVKQGIFIYKTDNKNRIINDSIKFQDEENGYIRIYEDVKHGYPYAIGGDTSGEGSNYFVGQVINNVSGVQVATLRQQFDEDLYSKQMYCLGIYYNTALLSIEVNYSTYPIKELERLIYPKQCVREVTDTFTGAIKKAYGFRTDKISRPVIIANLVQIVREHVELFNDIETLEEMLTFVRNEKGRPEAQQGKHDDMIIAIAIAYYTRTQQTTYIEKDKPVYEYPEEDFDDYHEDGESFFD
jgi:phage terminase large subunit